MKQNKAQARRESSGSRTTTQPPSPRPQPRAADATGAADSRGDQPQFDFNELEMAINRNLAFTELLLCKLRIELEPAQGSLLAGFSEIADLLGDDLQKRMDHTWGVWRQMKAGGAS